VEDNGDDDDDVNDDGNNDNNNNNNNSTQKDMIECVHNYTSTYRGTIGQKTLV